MCDASANVAPSRDRDQFTPTPSNYLCGNVSAGLGNNLIDRFLRQAANTNGHPAVAVCE